MNVETIKKIINKKIVINYLFITILYNIFNFVIFNNIFIKRLTMSNMDYCFKIIIAIVFFLINFLFYIIILNKFLIKKIMVFLTISNSLALYFIDTYNIPIDKLMFINIFETNSNEILAFFNIKIIIYLIFFGILPSIFICKNIKITYFNFKKMIVCKLCIFLLAPLFVLLSINLNYKNYIYTKSDIRKLSQYYIPINYIYSFVTSLKYKINSNLNKNKIKISENSYIKENLNKNNKQNILIFIIGESLRAKNMSFNGYHRNTNKYLEKYKNEIVNFTNFNSFATSTFISVPSMFSHLTEKEFKLSKAKKYENYIDIYKNLGFNIIWLSNNGNCKGVCSSIDKANKKIFSELNDLIFIENIKKELNNIIKNKEKNNIIFIHQRGNHGPIYGKNYTKDFEIFKPICNSANFKECSNEEIINSYDNNTLFNAYISSKIIEVLKEKLNNFNAALFYISDHGESLGENGIYLHGSISKKSFKEQKHVASYFWFSEEFINNLDININCLKSKQNLKLKHENIFHSMLGLFKIYNKFYKKDLDIFYNCN